MELSEKAEEVLETLWIETIEAGKSGVTRAEIEACTAGLAGASPSRDAGEGDGQPIETLQDAGYVAFAPSGLYLTERGRPFAENVVRRHRLAERLFADVLDAWNETNHEKACKFEHLLDRGLDDSICSLLGHPKVCPHGKPIPPGPCCREMRLSSDRVVSPLSQLEEGQTGKVAYIAAARLEQLQKLTAMGILPGAPISVIQTFPAYVFQAGQTQFAVDREIAGAIYVRLNGTTPGLTGMALPGRKRLGLGLLNRRH